MQLYRTTFWMESCPPSGMPSASYSSWIESAMNVLPAAVTRLFWLRYKDCLHVCHVPDDILF